TLPKLQMPAAITHMPLQSDEVLWEGQAIALVIAERLEAAEEAAALVRASIAPTAALIPGKGRLESPPEGAFWTVKGSKGDPPHGFEVAAKRIERDYFKPTRNHNPMETSACGAEGNGDELPVGDSTHHNKN